MYRLAFVVVLVALASGLSAQETTRDQGAAPVFSMFNPDSVSPKLLVVPFEPKLYRSEIDRYVGEANNLNFNEIRGYFRLGLDNALVIASNKHYEPFTMHADETDVNRDLLYIYKSVGYQFKEMPPQEPEEPTKGPKKLLDKLKRPAPKPEPTQTRRDGGQLVTTGAYTDKYMSTKVINPNMFEFLSGKYASDLYLFINQLDLVDSPATTHVEYGLGDYTRLIRVHYTIFDQAGNELAGGRAERPFSSKTNDIRKIIRQHFTEVAADIVADLESRSLMTAEEQAAQAEEKN